MTQSVEHSPGKRKVPGSNPGRSLGHFFPFGNFSLFSFFLSKKYLASLLIIYILILKTIGNRKGDCA